MTEITELPTTSPEALVRAFIADHERWNEESERGFLGKDFEAATIAAEAAYVELIAKYCKPAHRHSPISCGTESMHDSAHEIICSVELYGDRCAVKTKHTRVNAGISFTADYEYHLEKDGQRWYLTSILHVDKNGKYEGL